MKAQIFRGPSVLIMVTALCITVAMAQEAPLPKTEMDKIFDLEQRAVNTFKQKDLYASFAKVSGLTGTSTRAKEEYVTAISIHPESKTSGRNATAVLSRYIYEKGLTLQTTIDLKEHKVLKIEPLQNYPTPLAPAEVTNAIKLAREKNPAVKQMVAEMTDDEIKPDFLALHADSPSDPKRGHRLVRLSFLNPKKSNRRTNVIVDLTDGTVVPD